MPNYFSHSMCPQSLKTTCAHVSLVHICVLCVSMFVSDVCMCVRVNVWFVRFFKAASESALKSASRHNKYIYRRKYQVEVILIHLTNFIF